MQYIECHKQKADDKEGNSFASKEIGVKRKTTYLNDDLIYVCGGNQDKKFGAATPPERGR